MAKTARNEQQQHGLMLSKTIMYEQTVTEQKCPVACVCVGRKISTFFQWCNNCEFYDVFKNTDNEIAMTTALATQKVQRKGNKNEK